MLPLSKQNAYRQRYHALNPQWQTSGDDYERLVREAITKQTRLLDIGGGRGGLIEIIHDQVAAATALDPDLPSLIDHRAPTVNRLCGLADSLPFANNSFDVITASWLLEHLAQPEIVFKEIHRVLDHNGKFIFLTPNFNHPLLITNYLLRPIQRFLVPRLYSRAEEDTFPVRYKVNTPGRLHRVCDRVGFRLELSFIADPTYTAFNDPLFNLSAWLEKFIPQAWKIHLIGVAVK
ncbi:MAG: methyltransferase domain-containing protein [Chloroflexi bacterium]|nr:methyltransferase domain-containing protein [Chloroflexota bacterium]